VADDTVLTVPKAHPRYLEQAGRHLFTWHHPPSPDRRRGAGVVLCPPIGSDYVNVYLVWRQLAQRLAADGFDVLRFDYEGTGDSDGDLEEPGRVAAWTANIGRMIAEAQALTRSPHVALVALRIGAALALQAASECGGVDRLVLWSPYRSGRAYVRELWALSRLCSKDYVIDDNNPDILAAGYVLPRAVAQAIEHLDVPTHGIAPANDVLLVDRDDRAPDRYLADRLTTLGARVSRAQPEGTAMMLEQPARAQTPHAALGAIAEWLVGWRPLTRSIHVLRQQTQRESGSRSAAYQEQAVRFGSQDRLFGILTSPTSEPRPDAAALILLNTGIEYRIGPHRLYTPLARDLAAQGHAVLRYDVGGIGDSLPPPGAPWNVAYPPHALADLGDAIAFLRAHAQRRPVLVAGLCSGAWFSFLAARDALDVDGILAVNPPLYLREGFTWAAERGKEYLELRRYRKYLRDRARWANALRGRSQYVHFVRVAAGYAGHRVATQLAPILATRHVDGLTRDLDRIGTQGITARFVFSSGDAGLEYFQMYARSVLRRRSVADHVSHVVVPGAGHTFSPPEAQQTIRRLLTEFVTTFRLPATV